VVNGVKAFFVSFFLQKKKEPSRGGEQRNPIETKTQTD